MRIIPSLRTIMPVPVRVVVMDPSESVPVILTVTRDICCMSSGRVFWAFDRDVSVLRTYSVDQMATQIESASTQKTKIIRFIKMIIGYFFFFKVFKLKNTIFLYYIRIMHIVLIGGGS